MKHFYFFLSISVLLSMSCNQASDKGHSISEAKTSGKSIEGSTEIQELTKITCDCFEEMAANYKESDIEADRLQGRMKDGSMKGFREMFDCMKENNDKIKALEQELLKHAERQAMTDVVLSVMKDQCPKVREIMIQMQQSSGG